MNGILLDTADGMLLVAVVVTSIVIFTFFWRSLQSAIGAAVTVVILLLIFQFAFDISPNRLLHEVMRLGHEVWHKIGRYLGVL